MDTKTVSRIQNKKKESNKILMIGDGDTFYSYLEDIPLSDRKDTLKDTIQSLVKRNNELFAKADTLEKRIDVLSEVLQEMIEREKAEREGDGL